jgi:carbon storage regulator CsrA
MLVLSRRADESILIQPAEGADGSMTLAQLFANGRRVKVGIEAPEQLAIRRKDAA